MRIISVSNNPIDGKEINVNNEKLSFDFQIPEIYPENFFYLVWWEHENNYVYFTINNGDVNDQTKHELSGSEEDYNTYVKPFVDQWQAEKDRIEQEQAEYESFENRQARALVQLDEDFETVKDRAHIKSSLGFEADANQTANENVTGLLVTIGDGEIIQFCDYYNRFHELNESQLQTLQVEIISNAQNLYAQKWQYRTAIEGCTDNDQLDEVVEGIKYTYMDFTPQEAQEAQTGDGGSAEQTE